MVGKTLISVLALVVLGGALLFAVFRGLGATDQKFQEIETEFHGHCLRAFDVHVRKPAELCTCLWEEVRGENRLEMLKRLNALEKGTADEKEEFMTRVAAECARRLRIEPR